MPFLNSEVKFPSFAWRMEYWSDGVLENRLIFCALLQYSNNPSLQYSALRPQFGNSTCDSKRPKTPILVSSELERQSIIGREWRDEGNALLLPSSFLLIMRALCGKNPAICLWIAGLEIFNFFQSQDWRSRLGGVNYWNRLSISTD